MKEVEMENKHGPGTLTYQMGGKKGHWLTERRCLL